jgi:hypothetical protein
MADLRAGVEQQEAGSAALQVIPEGETGLAGAHDENVEQLKAGGPGSGNGHEGLLRRCVVCTGR